MRNSKSHHLEVMSPPPTRTDDPAEIVMKTDPDPIVSVDEARRLLGADANNMTDGEVSQLVVEMDELAKLAINSYIVQKSGQSA